MDKPNNKMMRTETIFHIVILFLLQAPLSCAYSSDLSTKYQEIVVFGDSYFEQGNIHAIEPQLASHPYLPNRFTNGLTSIEWLANAFQVDLKPSMYLKGKAKGTNYSTANAKASTESLIDLQSQVGSYLSALNERDVTRNLFIIQMGMNDIRTARDATNRFEAYKIIKSAANNIKQVMIELLEVGAKDILLVNAPNIGALPESIFLSSSQETKAASASHHSLKFNSKLNEIAHSMKRKYPQASIKVFDLYRFLTLVIYSAGEHGLENIQEACYQPKNMTFHEQCGLGKKAENFLFFDDLHLSSNFQRSMGQAMVDFLIGF